MKLPIAEMLDVISKAAVDVRTTPIQHAAEQSAETLARDVPKIPQHMPDVPYAGSAEFKQFARATSEPAPRTLGDIIQSAKRAAGGFVTAEPNAPKAIQQMFLGARYSVETAQARADHLLQSRVLSPIQGDIASKARILSDYLTVADEYADLHSKWSKDPNNVPLGRGGRTLIQIEDELMATRKAMIAHPDLVQANSAFRAVADEMFNEMVKYGLITPDRHRTDWTPRQQLLEMARGLEESRGNVSVGGDVIAQMEARKLTGGVTETNMVKLMRSVLRDFNEKVAGDELVLRLMDDPTLNRAAEFKEGQQLPTGWSRFRPRPGLPGWRLRNADAQLIEGVVDGLGVGRNVLRPGDAVMPTDLVQRLENFYTRDPSAGADETAFKMGRAMARWFTVYNPANTAMNAVSDAGVAMLGLPGERSDVGGFLRFFPRAMKASWQGAFGHENADYTRAVVEGIGSSTFVEQVTGETVPAGLAAAMGTPVKQGLAQHAANLARRARTAVEATPRIAAGLAAEARTGNPGEFARVGRAITLPYGAGAPAHTRGPVFRLIAPFMQFVGLATERTGRLLTTKGSRGRAWAAVLGVPMAAFLWNRQNAEFQEVEYSLRRNDRMAMHVILRGEDGKVARDEYGQPRVMRFRYFVPEEIAGMFGLSNMPARIADLATGRETLGSTLQGMGEQAVASTLGQIVPAQVVAQLASGRNLLTGQKEPRAELAAKSVPIVRQAMESVTAFGNKGPIGGAIATVEQMGGVRFAQPLKKGRADADILAIKQEITDARARMVSAARKGDRVNARRWKKEIARLHNRIRAIAKTRRVARVKG